MSCSGAQLTGRDKDGYSLSADRLKVDGSVFLRVVGGRPFTAAGAVRLLGAHITSELNCSGAQLTGRDKDGYSFIADGIKVDGGLFLRGAEDRPFTAAGAVRLLDGSITNQLSCSGAQLTGRDKDGYSLSADRLKVDGSLFLRVVGGRPFTAAGAVRLLGAHITSDLDGSGAQLTGRDKDGYSLFADGIAVDGGLFLAQDRPFMATGAIGLGVPLYVGRWWLSLAFWVPHKKDRKTARKMDRKEAWSSRSGARRLAS